MKSSSLTDQQLVRLFVDGDHSAFETLLHRHKQKIYTYIFHLVKEEALAEDIFQDTFIKIIKSLKKGRYKDEGRFISWAMRIAHNLVIDYYRKQKNYKEISNDNNDEIDIFNDASFSGDTIEQTLINRQISANLKEIVSELPEDQRSTIIMRHYLGMSFKEIAEHTEVSINTALGRMRYAIINMRKIAEEKNMSLTLD